MSTLSRYNLLISAFQYDLQCQHNLGSTNSERESNDLIISKSLMNWFFLTDDLMCDIGANIQSRDVRLRNLAIYISHHNISATLKTLKLAYDLLIGHISQKSCLTDFGDFKGHLSETWDPELGFLLSPVKESVESVLASQIVFNRGVWHVNSTRDMWRCAHYFQFLNKLNLSGIGLEGTALEDYMVAENETAAFDLHKCERYIPALSRILKFWLQEWDYDGSAPHHGPGSVADATRDKVSKYLNLAVDAKVEYLLNGDAHSYMPYWHKQVLERTSKLVFVPKNITKLRSISMEPATLQYLQQGCMVSLYSYFEHHQPLSGILKLQDQHQNKSFAYHSSITDDYATIDLSHASDSVNWELVKRLFCRVPKLLKWLICTRSTHTLLPTGERLLLKKFAPMGSALCFPIESLIFAGIAKLSVLLSKELATDRDPLTGIRCKNDIISVYGDDIIVPAFAADTCVSLLRLFGFTPNDDKSYLYGPFKESCGGNYFCGFDITPIKFSPKYNVSYTNGVSPNSYTALCSYANLAYERGFKLFRLHCIKEIFRAGLKPIFSSSLDEAPSIYSPTPTNFHLDKRYKRDYQKYYYKYTGVKTVQKEHFSEDVIDEDIFLFDNLLNRNIRKNQNTVIPGNGAIATGNFIIFDNLQPYMRSSLLAQTLKFTVCCSDV